MIPEIEISSNEYNPIYDLVKAVHKYYPIGLNEPNDFYAGYQQLKGILAEKINKLMANSLPAECLRLEEDTQSLFKNYPVLNSYHRQFPNYALDIKLPDKKYPEIQLSYHLKIRISLLTNYYTLFFEEVALHKNIMRSLISLNPMVSYAVSSTLVGIDGSQKMIENMKNVIQTHFPNHQFVNHNLLMLRKMHGGYPHGTDPNPYNNENSFYNFLFDNEYSTFNLSIGV